MNLPMLKKWPVFLQNASSNPTPELSHVHEKTSSGAGAVTFLRRLRSPEIIHTVAGHIDDPE